MHGYHAPNVLSRLNYELNLPDTYKNNFNIKSFKFKDLQSKKKFNVHLQWCYSYYLCIY